MSIINQTLRELDARKNDSVPSRTPLRPVAAALRHRPGRWAASGVLLAIAGLAVWLMPRAVETALPPPAVSTQHAVALQAVVPASSGQPMPLSVAVPEQEVATVAAASPVRAVDPNARVQAPASGGIGGMSDLSLTMKLSAAVDRPPVIRKEANTATVEEEANERYRKAVTLMQKGRENQARPLLEEAIRLSPGHAAARQMLATLLSEAGQNREAEAVLREGCAVSPDNTWFALGLARLQAARGDTEGAVASLQGGAEGRGVNAEYHATLAALLVRLKRHPEAARQYQLALKLQPDQGTWWLGLALSMEAQGKNAEARSAYSRALAAGNLPEKFVEFVRTKFAE